MFQEFYREHPYARNPNSITNIVLYLFYYVSTYLSILLYIKGNRSDQYFPPKHLSMYIRSQESSTALRLLIFLLW